MRVAYVILAHRLPEQLVRLVRRLNTPRALFLIHINRRSDDAVCRTARAGLAELDNAVFLRRHRLYWGSFGHVRATIEGLDELHRRSAQFDYVALLTGQDYPIKPVSVIERKLADSGGASFMAYDRLPGGWTDGMERITHWHSRRIGVPRGWHLRLPIGRRFPQRLVPYGGSSYWWLSREAVEYVRRFVFEHPDYYRFFKHVDVPDEIFFHTILMNSPLRDSVVNDELRYVDWTRDPMPAIFGAGDLELLRRSPKLLARKFDSTHDEEILDLIDSELLLEGGPSPAVADRPLEDP
ncbi:MAG: beta-1,6-N-acetylglucosaminyltransferase [Gemmatimonadota bacterium]|nr:beta-1,6-N-acetylglucosaminyltransferase [Gemmatimonadota bacterium]